MRVRDADEANARRGGRLWDGGPTQENDKAVKCLGDECKRRKSKAVEESRGLERRGGALEKMGHVRKK